MKHKIILYFAKKGRNVMKKNRLFAGMMATCILAAGLVGCGSSAAPEAYLHKCKGMDSRLP